MVHARMMRPRAVQTEEAVKTVEMVPPNDTSVALPSGRAAGRIASG